MIKIQSDREKPHVREFSTVLGSGFHTADSEFQVLDSSICELQSLVGSRFQNLGFRIT